MLGHTEFFGYLAAVFAALAYIRYIYKIRSGHAKPSKASWIVWSVVGFIIAVTYFYSEGGDSFPVTVVYAFGPPLVLFFILNNSSWELDKYERRAIVTSGLALVLWWIFRSAVTGLYIEIAADLFGAYGTVDHAKNAPRDEDVLTWYLSLLGAVINLLAVDVWETNDPKAVIKWLYPVIVVFMCATILATTLWYLRKMRKNLLTPAN